MRVSLSRALAETADETRKAAAGGGDSIVSPALLSGFSGGYGSGQPVRGDWDERRAIQEGYRGSTWPFTCMDRLQGACSSVPWVVYEKRGRSRREWERQDGHPYEVAIENPNDFISRQQLISGMILTICCGGNSLLKVIYVTRPRELVPSELYPMSTAFWRPVPVSEYDPIRFTRDREGVLKQVQWIEGYKRLDRPSQPMLEPWRVVHAQKLDPGSWIWGGSPMRSVAPIIDMDRAMVAWNSQMPNNLMVPSGAFVDRNLKTDGQIAEKARQLQERYQSPDRARTPLVLGAGTDWLRMALTPVEMDWDVSREHNMIEICGAFNVSPTLFISDAKYANLEAGKAHLLEMGAHDLLCLLEDAFNRSFVPRGRRGEIYIAFDISGVPGLKDTLPQRLESHARAVASGIPINRSIIMHNLDTAPVPGGDVPLVLGTLVSLEQLIADPQPSQDDGTDDNSAPGAAADGKKDPAATADQGASNASGQKEEAAAAN